jgi:ComEC/Rec2-related protein
VVWSLSAALIAGVTQRPGVGVVFVLIVIAVARGPRARAVAGVAAALCVLYGLVVVRGLDNDRACFLDAASSGATLGLEGVVASFPRTYPYGTEFSFDTRVGGRRVRLRLRATRFDIHYGDRLRARARYVRTRTPTHALYAEGQVGVVRAGYGDIDVDAGEGGARRALWLAHRHARVALSRHLGSRSGLPLALLIGERGFVDRRARDAFARLGASHLLALSGMHLGIVAGLAWSLLGVAGGRRRSMLAVLASVLAFYVGVVGEVHSLRRALVMAVVLIAARLLERPPSPTRALGLALFLLLSIAPASAYSVGFQLSFAATFAVILVVTHLPRPAYRGRIARAWSNVVIAPVASAGVLVFVAPMQLGYFGALSVMSPLATIAFLPPVAVLLVGSALFAATAGVPAVGPAMQVALALAADATENAALILSRHTPAPIGLPVPDMAVYYAGLSVAWIGRRHAWAVSAGVIACTGAFWMGRG